PGTTRVTRMTALSWATIGNPRRRQGEKEMGMSAKSRRASRRLCVGLLVFLSPCLLVCVLAGCGGPRGFPVSGTARVDGKPLVGFVVTFNPDAAKGHEARMDCSGRLGGDGRYSLRMDDGFKQYQGAPPGWYKVTIWSPDDKPIPVNKKYTNIKTTDLTIEVVADPQPGAYDLKFTR